MHEKARRQAGSIHALGTERSSVWLMLRRVVEKTNVRNKLETVGRD